MSKIRSGSWNGEGLFVSREDVNIPFIFWASGFIVCSVSLANEAVGGFSMKEELFSFVRSGCR